MGVEDEVGKAEMGNQRLRGGSTRLGLFQAAFDGDRDGRDALQAARGGAEGLVTGRMLATHDQAAPCAAFGLREVSLLGVDIQEQLRRGKR